MNEQDHFDTLLDSALNELPMVPLPPNLIANVMAQIAPKPTFEPFRIQVSDVWLALTAAFAVACLLFSPLAFIEVIANIQLPDVAGFIENASNDWLTFTAVLVAGELLLAAVIYAGVSFGRITWHEWEGSP